MGVGCYFLLQGIFQTQGSNPRLLCPLHWQASFFTTSATWEALHLSIYEPLLRKWSPREVPRLRSSADVGFGYRASLILLSRMKSSRFKSLSPSSSPLPPPQPPHKESRTAHNLPGKCSTRTRSKIHFTSGINYPEQSFLEANLQVIVNMNHYSAIMVIKETARPYCSVGSWGQVRRKPWHLSLQAWGVITVSESVKGCEKCLVSSL